ncbi:hypothetical protein [Pararhodobacter oceanensis]|uniref:hypothetical protein n=1 Tax=Pararhodobacter oceanensis TaxID=2172121 RepID=UPI003A9391F1
MSLRTGDIVEIKTPRGWLQGLVMAQEAGYPPAIGVAMVLHDAPLSAPATPLDPTALQVALMPLDRVQRAGHLRVLGAQHPPPSPVFRVPVRDRAGAEIYDWIWQEGRLRLRRPEDADDLPLREIRALDDLVEELAGRAKRR